MVLFSSISKNSANIYIFRQRKNFSAYYIYKSSARDHRKQALARNKPRKNFLFMAREMHDNLV